MSSIPVSLGVYAAGGSNIPPQIPSYYSDPYWSNVVCLMHGDTLNDTSNSSLTITNSGTTINTSTYKYGTGSMYFNGSSYLSTPTTSILNLGGSNFTIEFWYYANDISNSPYLLELYSGLSVRVLIMLDSTNGVDFNIINSGGQWIHTISVPALATWHHVAAVVNGSTMSLYLNGVFQSSTTTTYSVASTSYKLNVGYYQYGNTQYFNGYIDDLRITRGVARYTASFTPPTYPFPNM